MRKWCRTRTCWVTRQAEPKAVTIKSVLSHKVYGKYGKLYAEDPITYAQYKDLAALYNQEVSAEILVRGTEPTHLWRWRVGHRSM